jgi:hypothetical protein
MNMNKTTWLAVSVLLLLAFIGGVFCAYSTGVARADGTPPTTPEVKPVLDTPPIVSAVPYLQRTEYEQDPFDTTRLRRTTTVVTKVLLIRADGTTKIKDTQ